MNSTGKKGRLIVVSGPSGVGKGTVLSRLLEYEKNMRFSISATTRQIRPGETNKMHYYFISKEEFRENIDNGRMLEWAEYNGNYYGTPRVVIEGWLREGYDVLLDIEVAGAMQVKKSLPGTTLIFVLPPSMKALRERLSGRGTEDIEMLEKRLEIAKGEISFASNYDYIVINDIVDEAVEKVRVIVQAEKYKYANMQEEIGEVIKDA
jgi:guanylate kinase